jgi:hypothetical protein
MDAPAKDQLFVRVATADELAIAIKWAAQEGWNPGRNDAECFYAADPEGFFVGLLGGEPAATISAVVYDDSFAFAGFYITRPDLRMHGFGLKMRRAATRHMGSRTVGLDGVLAQEASYKKYGFTSQYHNIRYEGVGGGDAPKDVVPLSDVEFEKLVAYDAPVFATRRPAFLRAWIDQPGATAVASIKGGEMKGYGVMRPCERGFKIGPLFADDEAVAESLFQAMASRAPGEPIFLDLPETNPSALALATRHAMQPVFQTVRMYSGKPPQLPLGRIYGVTTFELG